MLLPQSCDRFRYIFHRDLSTFQFFGHASIVIWQATVLKSAFHSAIVLFPSYSVCFHFLVDGFHFGQHVLLAGQQAFQYLLRHLFQFCCVAI
jgi:hypothetical protein